MIEVFLASSIFAVVFGQLFISLVSIRGMIEETIRETDLALAERTLWERLLFRLDVSGGLLSAPYDKFHHDTVRLQYELNGTANSLFYDGDLLKATRTLTPFNTNEQLPRWTTLRDVSFINSNDSWTVASSNIDTGYLFLRFYLTPGNDGRSGKYSDRVLPITWTVPAFGWTVPDNL